MPKRLDQAGIFGNRDEQVGRHHAMPWMPPAQQCLQTHDTTGLQRYLWLIVQQEFISLQCMAQVSLH